MFVWLGSGFGRQPEKEGDAGQGALGSRRVRNQRGERVGSRAYMRRSEGSSKNDISLDGIHPCVCCCLACIAFWQWEGHN